jgi:hypothetical protein
MSLGSKYNIGQHVCRFAIPRAKDNLTLSVRFRENGVWSLWKGIRAAAAAAAVASDAVPASRLRPAEQLARPDRVLGLPASTALPARCDGGKPPPPTLRVGAGALA